MVAVECAAADSTFEEIAGWVGCLSAWLLFLSPIPTMRTIVRRRSVGDVRASPSASPPTTRLAHADVLLRRHSLLARSTLRCHT